MNKTLPFLMSLSFYITLAGLAITAIIAWLKENEKFSSKVKKWVYVPIILSLIALIANKFVSNEISKSNNAKIDSLNARISFIKDSTFVLKEQYDSTTNNLYAKLSENQKQAKDLKDSLNTTKKELNAIKPLPMTVRLRKLLTEIDPRILSMLREGAVNFTAGVTATQYNDLEKIAKEFGANKYISIGSDVNMGLGFGSEGVSYTLKFTLCPCLISDK
jgi:hypothetical protein